MKRILLSSLCAVLAFGNMLALNISTIENTCSEASNSSFTLLPTASLSASYAGLGPDQGDEPGYDTYQVIGAGWVTGAQNWTFQFTDQSGNVSTYVSGNFINTLNLQNVTPDLCYGEIYDVQVDVMVAGVWCGFGPTTQIIMEDEPLTELQLGFCNTTHDLYTIIQCVYIGNAEEYNWKFSTDNGLTEFQYNGGANQWVDISDIPEMRYSKIYECWAQAKVCGVWGEFSQSCFFTTSPLPYTNLEPAFCGVPYVGNAQFFWVPGATEYWAKVYLTDPDDPNFLPLGPSILYNITDVSTPVVPLFSMGLQSGNVYAVQVKPFVGEQQGDYGPVCLIYYDVPPGMAPNYNPGSLNSNSDGATLKVWPNPNTGTGISVDVSQQNSNYELNVLDMTGKLVFSQEFDAGDNTLEVSFDKTLSMGIYQVFLRTETSLQQQKIIVH
ncbi:MAG: hypothetical protein ACI9RU_001092 [Litorivivens sp.]|jgi:hypothetical protein